MWYHISKRLFDLGITLAAFALCSWLMLLIFIILFIAYRGRHVFFLQERIGLGGKTFSIFKFRTLKQRGIKMIGHSQSDETQLGNFLRKYSLDELPQLFNVLKGELSLVGPRPLPVEYVNEINKILPERHCIKPGLFGLAQNKGRNTISWAEKFEWDDCYIKNRSFRFDLQLFFGGIISLFTIYNGHVINAPLNSEQC